MTGINFLVFNVKQLIKVGTYVIVGLVLLIAIIYFFMPKGEASNSQSSDYSPNPLEAGFAFIAGTYSSEVILNNNPATVEVTVTENEITNIALSDFTENHEIFYPLLMPTMTELAQEIIDTQSLNITTYQDNPVTSQVLLSAISRALDEAVPQSSL